VSPFYAGYSFAENGLTVLRLSLQPVTYCLVRKTGLANLHNAVREKIPNRGLLKQAKPVKVHQEIILSSKVFFTMTIIN
jgi:hypothetical protein